VAYSDEEEGAANPRRTVTLLVGLAALAAGIMGMGYLKTGSPFFISQHWTPEQVDRRLQESPEEGALYRAIKASYPDDYRAFVDAGVTAANEHGGAAIEGRAQALAHRLLARNFGSFARAPNSFLLDIARQEVRLLDTLGRADVRLCAQTVMTGSLRVRGVPAEALAIQERIDVLAIRAASIGWRAARVPRVPLSPEEIESLRAAAARRSPDAARALADPRPLQDAPPEQQCAVVVALYEAAADFPAELAARAILTLLQAGMQRGGETGQ
jgi:hypothetical protein